MNDEDSIKIFRAESRDLLDTIEHGLLDLERNPEDGGLVAKVFRALHTLKGSGAMFGFDALADFAHHCETAFDRIRKGEARATPELICAVLAAIDHLHTLADGNNPPADEGQALLTILEEAVRTGLESKENDRPTAVSNWHLKFSFSPNAVKNGTRPLALIDQLRELGDALVVADMKDVPPLPLLDPGECHIGWDVRLTAPKSRSEIEEIFDFDRLNMTLSIEQIHKEKHDTKADRKVTPPATPATSIDEADETVRIPATRLDALMDCVGELVIAQSRLKQTAVEIDNTNLGTVVEEIERLACELRDSMMQVRMVPISHLFNRFRRLVHDLARETGKKIELVTEGEETEMDKTLIERLSDPLIHLIRNAADHGLETPENRKKAGKPETGHIRLATRQAGAEIVILFEDDGRGVDLKRVRDRAEETKLIDPGTDVSDNELMQFIFQPGFSTAAKVTGISGRGVGMDAVKTAIEAMHGTVELGSTAGKGVSVQLRLPLTLAIIDGLLVRVASERYVIPLSAVLECIELPTPTGTADSGMRLLPLRGQFVPYLRLRDLFEIGTENNPFQKIVVVSAGHHRIGLVVDEIVGDHQTVVKPLSCIHASLGYFSGATVLGDGNAALILDVTRIVSTIARHDNRPSAAS
jgi:two-component system, chemotaxis family, sensor kinase CheA